MSRSDGGTLYDGSRKASCYLNVDASESNTQYTLSFSGTMQSYANSQYSYTVWVSTSTGYYDQGSGSTSNSATYSSAYWKDEQTRSGSVTINKTKTTQTVTVSCGITWDGQSTSTSQTFTVPALVSHTVSYNANGGTGAPSSQTKWYGTILTLSSTKPTKTGFTFKGWATSLTGSVAYAAGASYGADADVTLYAVWENNDKQTIEFDANGGENAPDSITHQKYVSTTLPTEIPTRDGYFFLGWSKTKSGKSANLVSGGTLTSMSGRQTEESTFVWGTDVSTMKLDTTTVQDVELVKSFEAGNWIGHKAKEDVNPLGAGTYTMSFFVCNPLDAVNSVVTLGARVSDSEDKAEDITVPANSGVMRISLTFTRESEYTGTSYSEWLVVDKGIVYVGLAQIEEGTEATDWADYTESATIDYGAGWTWNDDNFTDGDIVTLYAQWKKTRKSISFYVPGDSAEFRWNLWTHTQDFGDDGSWVNRSLWTEESETYKGLTVLSKSSAWGGIGKSATIPTGAYVISFYAKSESDGENNVGVTATVPDKEVSKNSKWYDAVSTSTSWARYNIAFTVADSRDRLRIESNASDNKLYICGVKLEEGDTATPWRKTEAEAIAATDIKVKVADTSLDKRKYVDFKYRSE